MPAMTHTIAAALCLFLAASLHAQSYYPPRGGWDVIPPEATGVKSASIQSALDFAGTHHSTGVVILRHGKIIGERYWNNFSEHTPAPIFSVSKTVISVLIGILIDQRLIRDIGQPTSDFITEWKRDGRKWITLKHHLNMTTGLIGGVLAAAGIVASPAGLIAMPQVRLPGLAWEYNTQTCDMLYHIAERAAGVRAPSLAKRLIFDPLGMEDTQLPYRKPGNPESGFDAISSTPRDLARFGLMLLRNGRWCENGLARQMVNGAYLDRATTLSQAHNQAYGLLFWLNSGSSFRTPLHPVDRPATPGALLPVAPKNAYFALGFADNRIYVFPSQDMVIVRLGTFWNLWNLGSANGLGLAAMTPEDNTFIRTILSGIYPVR